MLQYIALILFRVQSNRWVIRTDSHYHNICQVVPNAHPGPQCESPISCTQVWHNKNSISSSQRVTLQCVMSLQMAYCQCTAVAQPSVYIRLQMCFQFLFPLSNDLVHFSLILHFSLFFLHSLLNQQSSLEVDLLFLLCAASYVKIRCKWLVKVIFSPQLKM